MKKTFTLVLFSFITFTVFAFDGPSKLSISTATNSKLRVMVDGNRYQSTSNIIMIRDLDQGFHSIKIFREKNFRRGGNNGWSNDHQWKSDADLRYELVYSSRIYIKPQFFVDIVINRFGKAFIDEKMMYPSFNENQPDADEWGDADNTVGNDSDEFMYNDMMPMSSETFDQFKMQLRNAGFDDTRMNIAKQVISKNAVTAKQVKEVVQQFTFESSKVAIAKFAYEFTIDKGSYFLVNDAFTFSSSKDELADYIESVKH